MGQIVRFDGVGPDGYFEVEAGSAEHKRLIQAGQVPVAVEGSSGSGEGSSEEQDLSKLTNAQLADKIREAGLEVPEEGSGSGREGKVVKKDLVAVLEQAEGSTLS